MSRDKRITHSAVKFNGRIYTGKRHALIMREIWDEHGNVKILADQQGFVTEDGSFLNRFQAGAAAFSSGQTAVRHQKLLSEHVWPE